MPIDPLRLAAFCAYLAAWVVFAIGAALNSVLQAKRQDPSQFRLKAGVAIGILLQVTSTLVITLRLGPGTLRPKPLALMGVLALAPFGAALFVGALLSAPRNADRETLVTRGVYAWMRHPIYLAFLAMLVATGLLASAGPGLAVAIVIYLAGSELRIASEEKELAATFRVEYEQYRLRTRWRYLPGVR